MLDMMTKYDHTRRSKGTFLVIGLNEESSQVLEGWVTKPWMVDLYQSRAAG